jgi:hypothetical protein
MECNTFSAFGSRKEKTSSFSLRRKQNDRSRPRGGVKLIRKGTNISKGSIGGDRNKTRERTLDPVSLDTHTTRTEGLPWGMNANLENMEM